MRIAAYLEYAWDIFKQHTAALVAAAFCLELFQLFSQRLLVRVLSWQLALVSSLLLSGLVAGGLMLAAQKAMQGKSPTLSEAFAPFRERQGDYLLVGLGLGAGVIACGVGIVVTSLLFLFAPLLVTQGADFKGALTRSKDLVLDNLGDCIALYVTLAVVNALGMITIVGGLVTLPLSAIAVAKAYEELSRPAELAR